MDRKQMCVANVQYKKSTPNDTKRAKNLLRYLTYRESRDEAARYVAGKARWADYGMGGSVGEIARRCDDLRSDHVLMFSLVINPNPQLTAMVAPEDRERFVRELTERTVEDFFDARGLDTGCEYAFVMHHRQTDDPQSLGMHNPHAHVVMPGTIYSEEHGERIPLYFSRNRKVNHIEMLHAVTEQNMTALMERYVGLNWEQRFDALEAVREQQRQVVSEEPHGVVIDEDEPETGWNIWCGARRTDEQTTAIGYYRWYPPSADDAETRLEFRPLMVGLSHEEAEFLPRYLATEMQGSMERLRWLAEYMNGMSADARAALVNELRTHIAPQQAITPDFDR
jgi:hypothetical protein